MHRGCPADKTESSLVMKAVLLAGGLGTRLGEETSVRPKPMVEIGGMPILWHIMKIYQAGGVNDFVVCLGYKGYLIKEYFANYFRHTADITIDLRQNSMEVHHARSEPWRKRQTADQGTDQSARHGEGRQVDQINGARV